MKNEKKVLVEGKVKISDYYSSIQKSGDYYIVCHNKKYGVIVV